MLAAMKEHRVEHDSKKNPPLKDLLDEFYKATVRPHIKEPIFLLDYPAEMIPLAKRRADQPDKIASMQLVVCGMEFIKAYNELNDPILQRVLMDKEQGALDDGQTEEAQPLDWDYVRALEIGLPPTAGWGMGIDRWVAFLADQPSINDGMCCPTRRRESFDANEFDFPPELDPDKV